VETFEAWLKENPYKPSRFLPMLHQLRKRKERARHAKA